MSVGAASGKSVGADRGGAAVPYHGEDVFPLRKGNMTGKCLVSTLQRSCVSFESKRRANIGHF